MLSKKAFMIALFLFTLSAQVVAQSISRTPWEMNRGGGWSQLGFTLSSHGELAAYTNAAIPATSDPNWGPAPNPATIGFSESSILPGYCLQAVDYTYFQTFVSVPTNTTVTAFTIAFSGIDDGGRVTIFNSLYPTGVLVPGSYVYLSTANTADLANYITAGENRVVVTQVDDCPTGNNLSSAVVILNGDTVVPNNSPLANAGADQASETAVVVLDGSASSDPDGDLLSYSWSENGNAIATGVNPTISLTDGSHTITLTVSDGELSATDQVVVVVTPVATAFDVWDTSDPNNYVLIGLIDPISTAQTGAEHYGYSSASAHPVGVNLGGNTSNIWMHENTNDGDLTFGFVFGMDASGAPRNHSAINFRIIDSDTGPWVSQSDDLNEAVETPAGSNAFVGNFNYGNNTDGIAVSGISGNTWTIIIQSVDFGSVITQWFASNGVGVPTNYSDDLTLALGHEYRITPHDHQPSGAPVLANQPPVADAGADQTAGCSPAFNLDGSGSTDDGELTYSWMLNSNLLVNGSFEDGMTGWVNNGVTYTNNPRPLDRLAHSTATDGSYVIDMVGTGDGQPAGYVEQTISTEAGGKYVLSFDITFQQGATSLLVTVDGGAGQAFSAIGSHAVTFTATSTSTTIRLSSDGSYPYQGNNVFLDNVSVDGEVSTSASFTTTSLTTGSYNYTLTVTDAFGLTDSDDVLVTVLADTEAPTLALSGDNPANVNLYNAYIDGGYTATDACDIDVAVSISGTVDHLTPGSYTLTYTAIDDAGNTTQATRVVTVINATPVADAGSDQTADCNSTFNLDGSGSTDDGALTYSWMLNSNLLVNGSFEDGMTGWVHTGVTGAGGNSIDRGDWGNATDGNWILDLVGTGDYATPGHVEQTISTEVGGEYLLSFDLIVNGAPSLVVTFDGSAPQAFSATGSHTIAFTATSTSTTIRLSSDGSYLYHGNSLFLDNVSVDGEVSTSASFTATTLPAGSYTYTLTVTDAFGLTDSDDVLVTVEADTEAPTITLLGSGPFGVNLHGAWSDPGYTTEDACSSVVTVVVTGTVDTETPGDYTLTYTATDESGNEATATRTVTVINAIPVAMAGDAQNFDCVVGTVDVDLDGSGSSDVDGDALTYSWILSGTEVATTASLSATHSAGAYTYTLTVSDGFDSSSDDVVVTVVDDTEPPIITLLGDNPMSLGLYLEYVEPGLETEDACGSEVTVVVTGTIDINIPGSYTLTYTATDAGGNASTAERIVNVINTAPTADPVSEVVLSFGEDILTADLDLATVFADVDVNDVLSYAFTSSNATVASVSLSGSVLSMSALDLGVSNISITATDPWGAQVTTYFTLTVNVTSTLADALLFAQSEIKIKKDVEVYSGNLLVNEGSSRGNHHDDDEDEDDDHGRYQLSMDKDSHVAPGYALMADRIDIKQNTLVESDVYANDLDNSGDITGDIFGDIVTPLFATLPPFKSGAAGSQNITVNKNQTLELAPGDYGRIYVKDRGTITFTGGIYNIEKLEAQKSSHVRFETATEVRVEDEVKLAKNTYVGPAGGSYIGASDIIFYISGDHHHSAKLEEDVVFYGTIYSEEGEVELKKDVSFTGSILAEKISIDKDCELTVDSYFSSTSGGGVSKAAGRLAWLEPEMEPEIPLASDLAGNYPNPFNPSTTIDFALSHAGQVSLKIYDIRGAEVAEIARGYHEAGYYSVQFNPDNLSSGTYLYVLDAGSFREVKRMVYLK